jgi:hypothetical protein
MFIRRTLPALALLPILAFTLVACEGRKPSQPPKPQVAAPAPAARTRDQAMAELMALPELKTWSAQIEKASHGKAHGAVIEDDPAPRMINGKPYWQLSFVEDTPNAVHRRQSFLVAKTGGEILVDDLASGTTMNLHEWLRTVHRVDVKSAD